MITDAPDILRTYRNETKIPDIGIAINYNFRGGKRVQKIREAKSIQEYKTIEDVK